MVSLSEDRVSWSRVGNKTRQLRSHTINYSANSQSLGLIVHTTVTIGYDVPWRDVHQALIEAALATDMILKEPPPFVLQTSLDDFYISYQLNAYTREPNKQATIYSAMHQNIQDKCAAMGIEIMSPHYRAQRDGSESTIPKEKPRSLLALHNRVPNGSCRLFTGHHL